MRGEHFDSLTPVMPCLCDAAVMQPPSHCLRLGKVPSSPRLLISCPASTISACITRDAGSPRSHPRLVRSRSFYVLVFTDRQRPSCTCMAQRCSLIKNKQTTSRQTQKMTKKDEKDAIARIGAGEQRARCKSRPEPWQRSELAAPPSTKQGERGFFCGICFYCFIFFCNVHAVRNVNVHSLDSARLD